MNTDLINNLIKDTVKHMKERGWIREYSDMLDIFKGTSNLTEYDEAVFCIGLSIIAHTIPLWENGQPVERLPNKCFAGALLFANTFKDETELQAKSLSGFGTNLTYQLFELPGLTFSEVNSHMLFHPGPGDNLPDFIGSDSHSYEAKYRFEQGSPSSLHKADYLINCNNPGIAVFQIPKYGILDTNAQCAVARYANVLTKRLDYSNIKCFKNPELKDIIESGALIYAIENDLKKESAWWK